MLNIDSQTLLLFYVLVHSILLLRYIACELASGMVEFAWLLSASSFQYCLITHIYSVIVIWTYFQFIIYSSLTCGLGCIVVQYELVKKNICMWLMSTLCMYFTDSTLRIPWPHTRIFILHDLTPLLSSGGIYKYVNSFIVKSDSLQQPNNYSNALFQQVILCNHYLDTVNTAYIRKNNPTFAIRWWMSFALK